MIDILIAVGISLTVSILLTPMLIRLFARQGFQRRLSVHSIDEGEHRFSFLLLASKAFSPAHGCASA